MKSKADHAAYMKIWRARKGEAYTKAQAAYFAEYRKRKQAEISAQQAGYRVKNKEKIDARIKAYWATRKEQAYKRRAAWRAANQDKITAWRAANPDIIAQHHRNRYARYKAAEGKHSTKEINDLFEAQGGKCAYCQVDITGWYNADHIVPLCKGGSNWITNIQLTCPPCNNKKRATDHEEFVKRVTEKS